jgi:hypothetical protein
MRGWRRIAYVAAVARDGRGLRPARTAAGHRAGRGDARRPAAGALPRRRRRLLPRHGTSTSWTAVRSARSTQAEVQGRNHVDRVGPAATIGLWDRLTRDSLGTFDLLKTISSHPPSSTRIRTRSPATSPAIFYGYGRPSSFRVPGPHQRAVLPRGDRTGSESLWPLARISEIHPARRIPSPTRRATREPRSARAARPCRWVRIMASRRGSSACGLFPNPDFGRTRPPALEPRAVLQRSGLLLRSRLWCARYRVGMSCGFCHVGPNRSGRRRSGEPGVGESELERRRAVFLVGPRLQLARQRRPRTRSSIRRCTSRGRGRSTPHSSRATTSTTRER